MHVALVCGNGCSIDRARDARYALHPSRPLSFPVLHPRKGTSVIEDLPHLRDWLAANRGASDDDFALIHRIIAEAVGHQAPQDVPASLAGILQDLRHFLALGYSTYQLGLDAFSMERWTWRRWLHRYRKSLVTALSWNYDLVLERALYRNRTGFFWPGAGGWPEWNRKPEYPPGIPICKPHGSCNFAGDGFIITCADTEGGPQEPVDYPRKVEIAIADVPQRPLKDSELLTVRHVADIVLPGEFNVFGQHLSWMKLATRFFRHTVERADTLVVIGFRMTEPDAQEFRDTLSWVRRFKRVVIADPNPSAPLVDLLSPMTDRLDVWRDGPEAL